MTDGKDQHLTKDLLDAIADGVLPPEVLRDLVIRHLSALCPVCRQALQSFMERGHGQANYDGAFAAAEAQLERASGPVEGELAEAERWLEELKHLPLSERIGRVDRARRRFRGRAFAQRVLEESRSCLPAQAEASGRWAELAQAAVMASAGELADLLARPLALRANALRVAGDRQKAADLFSLARRVLADAPMQDQVALAELYALQASLHIDLRQFGQAKEVLQSAIFQFEALGESARAASALISLSIVFDYLEDPLQAGDVTRKALEMIDPLGEPRLYVAARFNLAQYLYAAGRFREARDLLTYDADLYASFPDPWTRLRVVWLEGRIAAATDDLATAEQAFCRVRDGFAKEGVGFDVACVCMDLAMVYYRQHRQADVEATATAAVTLFQAQSVHRDALAALVMLRDAVRSHRATAQTIARVADYLETLRRDPSSRPAQPS